jgi:beta-glucosidase/6-phospho-beta-glucosidase/beta-galactosidase
MNKRYNKTNTIPFFITENGIADATDILRPSYMIEHLYAINKAQEEGVNILGYIFWTLSDNWEWADGYCPKFGLASVNRENISRSPRQSYYLYKAISTTKVITKEQRDTSWSKVQSNINKDRPFCRSDDGLTSLDRPKSRKISTFDWRFK